jgi:hypothetical protein
MGLTNLTEQEIRDILNGKDELTGELVAKGIRHITRSPSVVNFANQQMWLDQIIRDMGLESLQAFLFFTTSAKLPPTTPGPWITVNWDPSIDTEHLPLSQTCFNEITFPLYTSLETMRQKLVLAIHHTNTLSNF